MISAKVMKTVYIVVGCDTDPDRTTFLDGLLSDTLSWRGMLEGIPIAKERIKEVRDSQGSSPIFTWSLRADSQIKEYYGAYNWVLRSHTDFLLNLERQGDELAWHPHFWRFDTQNSDWYQECFDLEWQVNMLREAHADYLNILPGRAKSVRMGWDYHNTDTFATLESLGVIVDFSGIPGLALTASNHGVRSVNFFDWGLSPNRPYYPATLDYRREAREGETAFHLLEAPNFVSKSRLWGIMAGLQYAKKTGSLRPFIRSIFKPTYFIGTTGKPSLFAPLVDQLIRELEWRDPIVFVTYFHPDELLENKHPLYSLGYMVENLSLLIAMVRAYGATTKFIKASEIPGVVS